MDRLTPTDLDALRRAVEWGKGHALREPQIRVMPDVLPPENSEAWLKLATDLAATAQRRTLRLPPWETEPLHAVDDGVIDPNGWGNRPDEVALRRKMIALGISIYEPDPPAAIAKAEHECAT
jgi:hypothetical protein